MRSAILMAALVASSAAPAEQIESITVTADSCRRVTAHVPAPDVAYKPGVDVRGRAVAPADLGGGYPDLMPEQITINLGVDLADRLGRARAKAAKQPATAANRPTLPYEGKVPLGTVTLKGNQLYWNDQPLAPQDEAALAAACRDSLAAATPPPNR
jgi:hypothetical protein